MKHLALLAALLLAGCASAPKTCAFKDVQRTELTRRALNEVQLGAPLPLSLQAQKPLRVLALSRDGNRRPLFLFQAGFPGCPGYMVSRAVVPVVVSEDPGNPVVVGYGADAVKEMVGQGWVIPNIAWPWQRYDFSYLPQR